MLYSDKEDKVGISLYANYGDRYKAKMAIPFYKNKRLLLNELSFKDNYKTISKLNDTNYLRFKLFLCALETKNYVDISCVLLIQCIDGFMNLVNEEKLYKRFEEKDKALFANIDKFKPKLTNFFSLYNKIVFPKEYNEERNNFFYSTKEFINNCYFLRNTVSHNKKQKKYKLKDIEYLYLADKLSLCLKLFMIQIFGFNYDKLSIENYVKEVDNFYLEKF